MRDNIFEKRNILYPNLQFKYEKPQKNTTMFTESNQQIDTYQQDKTILNNKIKELQRLMSPHDIKKKKNM